MLRLRNKQTKEHKKFHTHKDAAEFLRCSRSHVSYLATNRVDEIRGWVINNYSATKPRKQAL